MSAKQKIETAAEFKMLVVDADYANYKAHPLDLRLAYHLALGLFHLRDWTFWQFGNGPTFPHRRMGDYQNYLEGQCAFFGYMRDLANSVKHAELDPNQRPSTQMVGLANTEIAGAAFQPGVFQSNAFQTRTAIVSQTSPTDTVDFDTAADAVMTMWNTLFAANGWT